MTREIFPSFNLLLLVWQERLTYDYHNNKKKAKAESDTSNATSRSNHSRRRLLLFLCFSFFLAFVPFSECSAQKSSVKKKPKTSQKKKKRESHANPFLSHRSMYAAEGKGGGKKPGVYTPQSVTASGVRTPHDRQKRAGSVAVYKTTRHLSMRAKPIGFFSSSPGAFPTSYCSQEDEREQKECQPFKSTKIDCGQ